MKLRDVSTMDETRPMYGPLLKVERANHHISELEGIFDRYVRANARSILKKPTDRARQNTPIIFGAKLPKHTPTVIGDVVHNLRVSLDHAYWILVESNGGTFSRRVKFPFGEQKSIEGSVKNDTKTSLPTGEVLDFIFSKIEPFEGGRLGLYDLHQLDITDKHQLLLPTYRSFKFEAGQTLSAGERRVEGENGARLIFTNPREPMFTADVPFKYTGNIENAIEVLFGKGQFEERPVLDTLRKLSENTTSTIEALEAFI